MDVDSVAVDNGGAPRHIGVSRRRQGGEQEHKDRGERADHARIRAQLGLKCNEPRGGLSADRARLARGPGVWRWPCPAAGGPGASATSLSRSPLR